MKKIIDIKESAELKQKTKELVEAAKQDITFQPSGNRVMVMPIIDEYKGLIIFPDGTWEKMTSSVVQTAKVVAVGPGAYEHGVFVPTTFAVGDLVSVFPNRQEADLVLNNVLYLIYPERAIIGKY
jgi:co-chaperonin GroES (HSP10)